MMNQNFYTNKAGRVLLLCIFKCMIF